MTSVTDGLRLHAALLSLFFSYGLFWATENGKAVKTETKQNKQTNKNVSRYFSCRQLQSGRGLQKASHDTRRCSVSSVPLIVTRDSWFWNITTSHFKTKSLIFPPINWLDSVCIEKTRFCNVENLLYIWIRSRDGGRGMGGGNFCVRGTHGWVFYRGVSWQGIYKKQKTNYTKQQQQ